MSWKNSSAERETSHLWQSRQSGSVEAKLQTFRSPGRAEVRKLNTSLEELAEQKCGTELMSHHR